jgi:sulfate permease, SulP family
MALVHGFHLKNLRGDIFGGLTAAVVALPLALAFGVASGVGPIAGLYGAVIVGFLAALLGGTPSQISGPTGPMTVVMAVIFLNFSDQPAIAFTIIMMGGLFQILFSVLRLGSLISLVPYTVISGFMSGIGVIIIILQIGPLFGHVAPEGGVIGTFLGLAEILDNIKWDTAAIGLGVLAIVWLMPAKLNRILPAPLVGLVIGTLLVMNFLPAVSTLGEIPTGLPGLKVPELSMAVLPSMVGWALILALLGSIDSLLTSLIADSVTRTHHLSNRELFGQGMGNFVAGIFGGIPGAGATMRTLVNVRAGGATPLSGMLHALILLAIVLGFGPLASHIPDTVLAGILIKVGIDIIDWGYLKRVTQAPRSGVVIMFIVLGLTVFVDLIVAFATGMVAASLLLVKRMTDLQLKSVRAISGEEVDLHFSELEQKILSEYGDRIVLYHFDGPVSFGAAKGISKRLVLDETHNILVLDLTDVPTVDTTGAFALDDVIVNARDLGASVVLAGANPAVLDVLNRLGVMDGMAQSQSVETRQAGLQMAEHLIRE